VYAVIESEKLGQEPENAPFAGLRGEDAEVGARLTDVTKDGPAEKGGLKTGTSSYASTAKRCNRMRICCDSSGAISQATRPRSKSRASARASSPTSRSPSGPLARPVRSQPRAAGAESGVILVVGGAWRRHARPAKSEPRPQSEPRP